MVQVTPFLLLLNLALGAHSISEEKCNLVGHWTNDLGSNMTIQALDKNGNFSGLYNTSVASTPNKIKVSPLLGSQHLTDQPTFGFTVNWSFRDNITVFMGQCFVDEDGKEVLKTMWLLRSHMDNQK
ncbi:AVID protein, partial [Sapayoa aenigma]|nr:AVID protein [Sapayoa aenigma]